MAQAADEAHATRTAQAQTQAKLEALQHHMETQEAEAAEKSAEKAAKAEAPKQASPSAPAQPAARRKTRFHDPSAERYMMRLFQDGAPQGQVDLGAVGDVLTLGSDPERASVHLTHDTVSGMHAKFEITGPAALLVTDLGSSNGTYVNEKDIRGAGAVAVLPGQMVQLGLLQIVIERAV
jgi:hypothetical protein